jgi:hypothetical protein
VQFLSTYAAETWDHALVEQNNEVSVKYSYEADIVDKM